MLLRRGSRPTDPAVEARVGRLLLPSGWPAGGWVPPQPDDDPALDDEWAHEDDASTAERSWAVAGELSGPPEPLSPSRGGLLPATLAGGRLDPGHRGAVALLLVCALAAVVAAGVVLRGRPAEVEVPVVEQVGTALPGAPEPSPSDSAPAQSELIVAVVGEVVSPGVVRLPPGSRVQDAVRAAGGLAPGGSSGLLNLARRLVDGEQVVVGPDVAADPAVGAAAGAAGGGAPGGLVDLNAATPAQLDGLPGIGPVLAERIVAWRTDNGPFASIDQLREVPGIGEAKYSSLKSKVAV